MLTEGAGLSRQARVLRQVQNVWFLQLELSGLRMPNHRGGRQERGSESRLYSAGIIRPDMNGEAISPCVLGRTACPGRIAVM